MNSAHCRIKLGHLRTIYAPSYKCRLKRKCLIGGRKWSNHCVIDPHFLIRNKIYEFTSCKRTTSRKRRIPYTIHARIRIIIITKFVRKLLFINEKNIMERIIRKEKAKLNGRFGIFFHVRRPSNGPTTFIFPNLRHERRKT